MWCNCHDDQSCHTEGKCCRALHNSCGYTSVRFCEVPTAGWDKNLENATKVPDATVRKVTLHGTGRFCAQQRKCHGFYRAGSGLPLPAQLCGILFSRLESPQSNEHVALLTPGQRDLSGTCSSAPSLIPAGAVQAQSYLLTPLTPRLPWKNAFLCASGGIYSPALPCALAEGSLSLSEAGNDVHETFITSDFGRTSYKML